MRPMKREELEELYLKYTKREYAHPDPVEFLFGYDRAEDLEIVGLIASSFAYGRVSQILKTVSYVLDALGKSPFKFLRDDTVEKIRERFSNFKYRFTTGEELVSLLGALKVLYERYDRMFSFFVDVNLDADFKALTGGSPGPMSDTVYPYIVSFAKRLKVLGGINDSSLIPDPTKGSACKRLNLFFRWMVREDGIDFGVWKEFPKSKLLIPLDTHMYRIGKNFGFTKRSSSSIVTAWEITRGFKRINEDDPVKYDFALTRPGILNEKGLRRYLEG